jgi:hypothetical protein
MPQVQAGVFGAQTYDDGGRRDRMGKPDGEPELLRTVVDELWLRVVLGPPVKESSRFPAAISASTCSTADGTRLDCSALAIGRRIEWFHLAFTSCLCQGSSDVGVQASAETRKSSAEDDLSSINRGHTRRSVGPVGLEPTTNGAERTHLIGNGHARGRATDAPRTGPRGGLGVRHRRHWVCGERLSLQAHPGARSPPRVTSTRRSTAAFEGRVLAAVSACRV